MQNITPGVDALRVIHGIIVGFFYFPLTIRK